MADVGVVVFRNGIQHRLGRRDRLQYGQPRPAEIRPVCRLVADHCHICDRRPPRLEINRGNAKLPQQESPSTTATLWADQQPCQNGLVEDHTGGGGVLDRKSNRMLIRGMGGALLLGGGVSGGN